MIDHFKERSTRTYRQKQLFSKEELTARESLCVHEQPPFCSAVCPLRMDVKEFLADISRGDMAAARQRLERVAPFPLILAHGCEAPCADKCRLRELPGGEAVDIPALERAVMAQGAARAGRGLLKFKKKKTAAVFGAELFALVLSGEIERKSYPLTFFVSEPDAETVIKKCAPFLSDADVKAEAARLARMDIKIEYNSALSPEFLAERRGGYDIICAARQLTAEPDAVSLVTADGVITRSDEGGRGVLPALFDARRAGVSVDRLAQGLDPAASRGDEGPVESKLYTDMSAAEATRRVPEKGGYTRDEAVSEALRCVQCRCEECIKDCVYLRHYKKFPRILTREIYNNVDVIMGDHMMNGAINSCSLCGECAVACPNGYDVADICLKARENMVETDKLSLAVHEFALLDMLFSNGEAFLSRPQPGYEKCKYVFFPGCQAGAVAPETVRRAYLDLSVRLPGGVALMLGCCGVIARWAGRSRLHAEQAELLKSEFEKLGRPTVIAACPSCEKELAERLGLEVVGVWDVLNEIGVPENRGEVRAAVMHDSCAARGDHDMQQAVRSLAEKLSLSLIETPNDGDRTTCCGYGGLVAYANREMASEMARDAAKYSDGPHITYCMACRDRFAREGKDSAHLLEIVYGSPAGTPPDISAKRKNRLSLKQGLLGEIWGEDVKNANFDFEMVITREARRLMDERMILDSDVWAVMDAYKKSGEAILDKESGLLVTRARLGNVTFWAKFTENAKGYKVHGAYSHRMTIETR